MIIKEAYRNTIGKSKTKSYLKPDQLEHFGYKKISTIGHHDIYHRNHRGTSDYRTHNKKTNQIEISLSANEKIHKKHNNSTLRNLNLYSSKNNELKAHDFYHHLIHKHNKILVGDNQSPGAIKVWQKLAAKRGVNIHGWDGNKPHNTNPFDEDETHNDDDRAADTARQEKNDYKSYKAIDKKIERRKLVASKGRNFKDDREKLGEEIVNITGIDIGTQREPDLTKKKIRNIFEVTRISDIKKSEKNSVHGVYNRGTDKGVRVGDSTTHEKLTQANHKKISSIGHHNIYHQSSGQLSNYIAHNTKTGKIDIGLSANEKYHKKHGNSTLSDLAVQSREGNELKAHHFYKHLIHKHNKILVADYQSKGGEHVWRKLAKEKGVNIHGWDHNKPHNTNPFDEDETHNDDEKTSFQELKDRAGRKNSLDYDNANYKVGNRKLVASKGRNFKDDREKLGEEMVNVSGSGAVAGLGIGPQGEPGLTKKKTKFLKRKKLKEDTFQGNTVFEVDKDFYHKCIQGKKKYAKYVDYVGDGELGQKIREFGLQNPKKPIIVKDSTTGAMSFLRYGGNNNDYV